MNRLSIWILAALIAAPVFAGSSWKQLSNDSCTADGEPYGCCSDLDAGTCNDRWALIVINSDVNWTQGCNQLALARRTGICGSDVTIENDAATAGLQRAVCPTEASGERFPYRRAQTCLDADVPGKCSAVPGEWYLDLARAGDGTHDGASGTGADVDYDKYPGGKYNNKPEFSFRNSWQGAAATDDGLWLSPWNGQCRTALRRWVNDRVNSTITDGEKKILKLLEPAPESATD